MKKYYSPVKDYDKFKRPHPFYKLARGIVKLFFPKDETVWQTDKPADGEPVLFVCNHTAIYAPVHFLMEKETIRPWANYYFLFYKDCWAHMKNNVLQGKRKWLLPLGFFLTPIIVLTFRAINIIPVYHKTTHVMDRTFKKASETFEEGLKQVVFPEKTTNLVNRYIYEFNAGFPMIAEIYYKETGKKIKFYPTYCAQKLHTVVIGEPYEYNPDVPMKLQRKQICEYLQNKICEMGDSLPEHEPVLYG